MPGVQKYIQAVGHPQVQASKECPPAVIEAADEALTGDGLIVINTAAPNNADGRPNGTIYIQPTA